MSISGEQVLRVLRISIWLMVVLSTIGGLVGLWGLLDDRPVVALIGAGFSVQCLIAAILFFVILRRREA